MFTITRHIKRSHSGFGLVEVMVGLVIGMIGIIVMMQVFANSEHAKRAATSGDDAQNNGIIALHGLQRDIRQAGYGFASTQVFGCNVTTPGGWTINTFAPVVINPGGTTPVPAGDANTDVVMVAYGTSSNAPLGDPVISQTRASFTYKPKTPTAYAVGDRIISAPGTRASPCALTVESVQSINPAPPQAPLNIVTAADVGSRDNGAIYNLGPSPKVLVYAIRKGNLTVCDYTAKNCADTSKISDATYWTPIASNVLSLRAQYGRDNRAASAIPASDENYIVNTFDQTAPTAANFCEWSKIGAVQVVVVTRSTQKEGAEVTTSAPTWLGSANFPIDVSKNPDGTNNPDWKHYRYKTFQTVIPLRNIAWMGTQGC